MLNPIRTRTKLKILIKKATHLRRSEPIVMTVKSWKDYNLPFSAKVEGVYDPVRHIVWIKKGASKGTYEHEKYHWMGGPNKPYKTARRLIREELGAHKYSYDNTGYPKKFKPYLRAIACNTSRRGKISVPQTLELMKKELSRIGVSERWQKDYTDVAEEANQPDVYGWMNYGYSSTKSNPIPVKNKRKKAVKTANQITALLAVATVILIIHQLNKEYNQTLP